MEQTAESESRDRHTIKSLGNNIVLLFKLAIYTLNIQTHINSCHPFMHYQKKLFIQHLIHFQVTFVYYRTIKNNKYAQFFRYKYQIIMVLTSCSSSIQIGASRNEICNS